MKAVRLFASLLLSVTTLAFNGCNIVTVKKPAGDKVARLDPKIWEGTWRGADNSRGTTTIKDQAKGLVEFRSLAPDEKKDSVTLTIRELKDRLVATAAGKAGEEAAFFRIAATEDHIAIFAPDFKVFREAVASGKIAGEVVKSKFSLVPPDKDRKPETQESIILKQFGAAELAKMDLHSPGSATECFSADPDMVIVREKKPESREEKKRLGSKK
jgi:hypothetical protein